MVVKEVEVETRTGLQARPAADLVELANQFTADLKLIYQNQEANLKSIISLMSLGISEGTTVTIQAQGQDAQEAIAEISRLLSQS